MTALKEKIILKIEQVDSPEILEQILQFITSIQVHIEEPEQNAEAIMSLAGTISDEDAKEVMKIIDDEFNHIEGEW